MTALYRCCDPRRRDRVRALDPEADTQFRRLNGLDFLEVHDGDGVPGPERQRRLFVTFIHPVKPGLTAGNFQIVGGERIRDVRVTGIGPDSRVPALARDGRTLELGLDQPGDFSRYTLRLVTDADHLRPPDDHDPRLAEIEFSFKVECTGKNEFLTEFDCAPAPAPAPPRAPAPAIDSLARDFQGLRRLMLDRLAALVPGYRGDNPADIGVLLVELLAYAADQRTYQQDSIATEAYLGTARRRVSVRRHARLVDYFMHEGCNARAFVQLIVADNVTEGLPPAGTILCTRVPGLPARLTTDLADATLPRAQAVFETMEPAPPLFAAHNRMSFYTWDDMHCTLPAGSTRATLVGDLVHLQPGHILVLEQARGLSTGAPEDADPRRRHPVRLTRVDRDTDRLSDTKITEITWALADALPFDLPLSTPAHADISVASGNIVLADHGRTIDREDLGPVPPARLRRRARATTCAPGCCQSETDTVLLPPRYRPTLARGPLTHAAPFDPTAPASAATQWDVRAAVPALSAREAAHPEHVWRARRDLLGASQTTLAFVAETDDDGIAALRFGDGTHGARPEPAASFVARYRIGNGAAGNLGAEAVHHVFSDDPAIVAARNPLPAFGGRAPESTAEVKQLAPHAFRRQERAVTAADYAARAETDPRVQRAAAALRWTGSFYTAFVQVDPVSGHPLDPTARADLLARLDDHRMTGHDLALAEPIFVPLELGLDVCARPGHTRGDVKAALHAALSRAGFFHPDNFTFGQPVVLSSLYAAAHKVPGVSHLQVLALRRQGRPETDAVASGELRVGPREIVRLDNDPNFAERGILRILVRGGK